MLDIVASQIYAELNAVKVVEVVTAGKVLRSKSVQCPVSNDVCLI